MYYKHLIVSSSNRHIMYEFDEMYNIWDASVALELNGLRFIMQQEQVVMEDNTWPVLFEKTPDYQELI